MVKKNPFSEGDLVRACHSMADIDAQSTGLVDYAGDYLFSVVFFASGKRRWFLPQTRAVEKVDG